MWLRRFSFLTAIALGAVGWAIQAATLAASPPVPPNAAIEFYHAGFDHYFVTQLPAEIDALDSGQTVGWTRTGRGFAIATNKLDVDVFG